MILQGKEPPPEYYSKPVLDPAISYLYEAFHELSTERQIGMALGPIPHSKIVQYGREQWELEGEALDRFVQTIREIDSAYLSAIHDKSDAHAQVREAKKKQPQQPKKLPPRPLNKRERR